MEAFMVVAAAKSKRFEIQPMNQRISHDAFSSLHAALG
jgi:hypothetical protein